MFNEVALQWLDAEAVFSNASSNKPYGLGIATTMLSSRRKDQPSNDAAGDSARDGRPGAHPGRTQY